MIRNRGLWSALTTTALLAGCLFAAKAANSGKSVRAPGGPGAWRLMEPIQYENLIIFPVVSSQTADTAGFATLDDALAAGEAVVTEGGVNVIRRTRDGRPVPIPQQQGASVNQLVLVNRGAKPLVLLAGEMVSGGKQDRIISKDRIVPPGAEPIPLDVFCVEQSRWTGGAQFSAGKIMVHPSVREKAAVDQEQTKVWAAVRNGTTSASGVSSGSGGGIGGGSVSGGGGGGTAGGIGGGSWTPPTVSPRRIGEVVATEAPTGAYQQIYKSRQVNDAVEPFVEEVQRRFARRTAGLKGESVVGVVIAYGGELAWSDIFASGEMFGRYWPKLLPSYVVEALARAQSKEQASLDDAREFLRPLTGHETAESEPGAYRLTQVTQGRYVEIELEALRPADILLHTLKIHRTS